MPLVSVLPESLQGPTEKSSRGHLIAHLQELLQHWVLWSAVKSRWVIMGKMGRRCPSSGHFTPWPLCTQVLATPAMYSLLRHCLTLPAFPRCHGAPLWGLADTAALLPCG